ncbi:MAG: N-acetylmannosamine-6-phosphate 2-epimerase [Erysipelotrichaceae bacterium]
MNKEKLINDLKGELIVSCQALEGEPLYRPEGGVMVLMAKAAIEAGAKGIRAQGVVDVKQIKDAFDVPVIGIIKRAYEGYDGYITITMKEFDELMETGCEIIAFDATLRKRGDGLTPAQFIKQVKEKYPDVLLMADCSSIEDALAIQDVVDFLGTTMSGYAGVPPKVPGPDYELMKDIVEKCNKPLIAEGRIHTPEQAKKAFECGAHCVVVGGAITRPLEITQRFMKGIKG